ncbi:MAG TPA: hypothetical protein VMD30_10040 [Tepidisphaeraceae bacterium]|nr:hypothetical protein [Tepidisphaeraceae bacterium]
MSAKNATGLFWRGQALGNQLVGHAAERIELAIGCALRNECEAHVRRGRRQFRLMNDDGYAIDAFERDSSRHC